MNGLRRRFGGSVRRADAGLARQSQGVTRSHVVMTENEGVPIARSSRKSMDAPRHLVSAAWLARSQKGATTANRQRVTESLDLLAGALAPYVAGESRTLQAKRLDQDMLRVLRDDRKRNLPPGSGDDALFLAVNGRFPTVDRRVSGFGAPAQRSHIDAAAASSQLRAESLNSGARVFLTRE